MKIAFVDSGMGGLVFAIDMLKSISPEALVGYEFLHVGDLQNVPYGLKTPDVLTKITTELIQKSIHLGAKKVIVACNTACTILTDEILKQFINQGVEVFSIKQHTAQYVFNQVQQNNANLLILATKRTVQSKMYKTEIENLFAAKNANINIIQHYPIEWESAVELDFNGFDAKTLVESELFHIKNLMGEDKFSQITHIGLFCTHYPIVKNEVFNFMSKNSQVKNLDNIISQGQAMSGVICGDASLNAADTNPNAKRTTPITITSIDKSGQNFALPTCVETYSHAANIAIVRE